jgi:PiT family inorganic phosphate transporter
MSPDRIALFAAAGAFAIASGANDGGTLLAAGLNLRSLRPVSAVGLLLLSLFAVPLLLGTAVASTLATDLVRIDVAAGVWPFVVAVCAAGAVVIVLAAFGLPTSLTLALIGGITGAGIGFALPVAWPLVALVLVVGLAAPLVGAAVAWAILRSAQLVHSGRSVGAQLSVAHRLAYIAQCIAYATNDGQKVLAILAVAAATADPRVAARPDQLAAITGLFAVGLLFGLPRLADRLGRGILLLRPMQAVSAEVASAGAVFGSTLLGTPVSMTQSIAGALIGGGMSEGYQRIRWRAASALMLAWVLTLPTATAVGALAGWAVARIV